jgi:hypothetical protein
MPVGWQNTPYRQSLANSGNNSYLRPAGDTAYEVEDFSQRSKGITVVGEVAGWNNLLNAESGSSRDQFNRIQTLYDANPGYTEPLMTAEEMLPPNEVGPYRSKVRVYGQTAIDYFQSIRNDYDDAGSVEYDSDINNAPDLPKSVRDILDTL